MGKWLLALTFGLAACSSSNGNDAGAAGAAANAGSAGSDGIKLVWKSSGAGTAAFFIYTLNAERPAAICEFDASANAGELPATVLSKLDPGASYYLEFRGETRKDATVGVWTMQGFAYSYGFAFTGQSSSMVSLD